MWIIFHHNLNQRGILTKSENKLTSHIHTGIDLYRDRNLRWISKCCEIGVHTELSRGLQAQIDTTFLLDCSHSLYVALDRSQSVAHRE